MHFRCKKRECFFDFLQYKKASAYKPGKHITYLILLACLCADFTKLLAQLTTDGILHNKIVK